MKDKANKFDTLLINRAYDPLKEPPPNQIVMRIEHKNIGSLQNFITITGMQKSGKGRYLTAIAAAAISRQEVYGISMRLPEHKQKICVWDTEQSDYDFYKYMDSIKELAGISTMPAHFSAFNVREDEPATILQMMQRYLELNPDCGTFIIDGLLDLVSSYNNEEECKRLINILKRWTKTYDLFLPCVIHKGKSAGTTLGHLGAMADRAAQSVLTIEKIKERGTHQLRAEYLRSADDFTPIEIYYNNQEHAWKQSDYMPEMDEKVKKLNPKPPELDKDTHTLNVLRVFNSEELQSYDMLVQSIREVYAQGRQWSKECVQHLMKEQLIFRTNNGYTNNRKARLFIQTS